MSKLISKAGKPVIYVGNYLSGHGFNPAFNVFLKAKLEEHFEVIATSSKLNKLARLRDMLGTIYRNRKTASVVLIDVYSSSAFWFAWIVARYARSLGLPYINILHGGNLPSRLKKNPGLCHTLFDNSAANVSPSRYLEEAFLKEGYQVQYIPNFIELANYKYKKRLSISPTLLWVRSLHKIYNPTLIPKIMRLLKDRGVDAHIFVAGPDKDGSLAEVQTLSKELSVEENITLTGRLSLPEWTALAENCDIFLNTTNFDNLPVSIIEAMGLAMPIISTNVGGLPYLIENGVDGILIEPDNAAAFADTIQDFIKNPEKTIAMAENARKKAESFDWKALEKDWLDVILKAEASSSKN